VLVDLGASVNAGDPVANIHFLERPDRKPEIVTARTDGYVIAMRAPCLTQQGDCIVVVAKEVDPSAIL
jgi:predicted deacylase